MERALTPKHVIVEKFLSTFNVARGHDFPYVWREALPGAAAAAGQVAVEEQLDVKR